MTPLSLPIPIADWVTDVTQRAWNRVFFEEREQATNALGVQHYIGRRRNLTAIKDEARIT